MAGLNGPPICCPYDKRRNGPVLGEASAVLCIEDEKEAKKRNANIYAKVKSVESYYDGAKMGKIRSDGCGLEKVINMALSSAKLQIKDIDYISCCANSSQDLDKIEIKILKNIFQKDLNNIPLSSIKSMIGETFSASGALQILSCIGAMENGFIPPTINYEEKDSEIDINCVPNKAQKKEVKTALITSFGPGGYNSACIIEKYK